VDESSTGLTRNVGFDPFRLVKVTPSGQRHGTSNRRMGCASNICATCLRQRANKFYGKADQQFGSESFQRCDAPLGYPPSLDKRTWDLIMIHPVWRL